MDGRSLLHTPVIWATQVLDNLAKTGIPSRAEITDAAMSARAECVMLNKGAYIVDAVRVLDDILTRMQTHQHKKTSMLRDLGVAERFLGGRHGAAGRGYARPASTPWTVSPPFQHAAC